MVGQQNLNLLIEDRILAPEPGQLSILEHRLTAGHRTLTPFIKVRILVLQPTIQESSNGRTRAFDSRDAGSNPDS